MIMNEIKQSAFEDELEKIATTNQLTNNVIKNQFKLSNVSNSKKLSDFNMDDLDRTELQMDLESTHNINLNDELNNVKTVGDIHKVVNKRKKEYSTALPKIKRIENQIDLLRKQYPKESNIATQYIGRGLTGGVILGSLAGVIPSIALRRAAGMRGFGKVIKNIPGIMSRAAVGGLFGAMAGGITGAGLGVNKENKTEYGKAVAPLTERISSINKKYNIKPM